MSNKKRHTFRRRPPGRTKAQNFSKGNPAVKFLGLVPVIRNRRLEERELWYHPTKGFRSYRVVEGTQHSLV